MGRDPLTATLEPHARPAFDRHTGPRFPAFPLLGPKTSRALFAALFYFRHEA
jgi:hypothetical protein